MDQKTQRHLFSHLLSRENPQSQNPHAVSPESNFKCWTEARISHPGNLLASACWWRCQPSVRAVTRTHVPWCFWTQMCSQTFTRPTASWCQHRRSRAWKASSYGYQRPGSSNKSQSHQLCRSCLHFRPALKGLWIVKLQDTHLTRSGSLCCQCLSLATFRGIRLQLAWANLLCNMKTGKAVLRQLRERNSSVGVHEG